MSFFDNILKRSRGKPSTPLVTDSTNSALFPQNDNTNIQLNGHENYNQYIDYPNILGDSNHDTAYHNAGRLHAPFANEREPEYYITGAGKHFFDEADPTIERIPRSELQRHFDKRRELITGITYVPDNGVEVPNRDYNYGWSQHYVALEGLYEPSQLHAPLLHLSRGINVLQKTPHDTHRTGYKAKAPTQKRSV